MQKEKSTRETGPTANLTVKALIHNPMALSTKDHGTTISLTASESKSKLTAKDMKVNTSMGTNTEVVNNTVATAVSTKDSGKTTLLKAKEPSFGPTSEYLRVTS